MKRLFILLLALLAGLGCGSRAPVPGPDKQGAGLVEGAVAGAGAGAIAGAQLSAATGPGAVVGAGFGAVAGSIKGAFADMTEQEQMELSDRAQEQRELAIVHEILHDHYQRRIALHPTRDIFPADLFFFGDEVRLKPEARRLVFEIARMNKQRFPWSRIVIASYVRSSEEKSDYAKHIAERRARELTSYFVQSGIEPRRIVSRPVILSGPLLLDPEDSNDRYNQAIEFIPLDRVASSKKSDLVSDQEEDENKS
ncbi:MAG: OmpA family protein [Bdellovibrionales bacterium]|nr:OmpA family protein [Bdellovibrionales bacterium]